MRRQEKFTKKLLVEGNDDQHVIWALCEKFSIVENFDIIDCEGIENLLSQIPVRFKQSGVDTVGIIIDADINIESRWQTIKDTLKPIGFNIPDNLPLAGLIVNNNENKTIGVWIMPNNQTVGMLEDFIAFLVPEKDCLMPIVDSVLNQIEETNSNKYSSTHKSKAKIHTWLSWQEDPGTPMGLAITKRYLTVNDTNCSMLINWILKLYK